MSQPFELPKRPKKRTLLTQNKAAGGDSKPRGTKPKRASAVKAEENISRLMKPKSTRKLRWRRSEEFEVDEIISHTIRDGQTIYQITWVGYPGYISEISEEGLVNCAELLKKYKRKLEMLRDRPVTIEECSRVKKRTQVKA
ncbi:hypothetical protein Q1695_014334 [Nippostrongylus brasiliensis]|nr:hypothetical protein Q1695_014334 [Nippostrongylus brasiliensis]